MKLRIRQTALAATITALCLPNVGIAIVGRHDRKDALFLKLGRDYDCVAQIQPDGTGTLVAPQWVLTAAHVAHSVKPGRDKVKVAGKSYAVDAVFIHPRAEAAPPNQPPDVDLALLRLASPVKRVRPAALHDNGNEVGLTVTLVGFGDTGDGRSRPKHTDGKRRAATNVVTEVNDDVIVMAFDEPPDGLDLEGVSGPGDSGGPALVSRDDQQVVVGVSSASMGQPGLYGVTEIYARVSTQRDWINRTIEENPPR